MSGLRADFEGFLKKQGGRFKAYKKRWFELRSDPSRSVAELLYFKNPKDKPAGCIPLVNCRVKEEIGRKGGFGFELSGPFARVYYLLAETETEQKQWVAALQQAIDRVSGGARGSSSSGSFSSSSSSSAGGSSAVAAPKADSEELVFTGEGVSAPPSGTKIGIKDFDLCKVIGRGSFGKVMKVRKKDTGDIFAMKVLRKDMVIRENMVQHTRSEKTILQQMQHPYIVKLCYAFQSDEKLYLVLDFLSGGELFFHLKQEGRFNEERAKFYAAEITMAIEHLHKHDIVYRDLKPENCVLDRHGHVCITDFGLAKTAISHATPTFTFCGTPEYLAPEILTGQGHSKGVDWWSLGVLLFEMLTGLPPFYSENVNDMYDLILRAPLRFPSYVSPSAQSLLRGLLERDDNRRLGSGPTDAAEIRSHPFFSSIDWTKLYNRQLAPPFVPRIKDDDTAYFDDEFTRERAVDSFIDRRNEPQEEASFDGFTFVAQSELGAAARK